MNFETVLVLGGLALGAGVATGIIKLPDLLGGTTTTSGNTTTGNTTSGNTTPAAAPTIPSNLLDLMNNAYWSYARVHAVQPRERELWISVMQQSAYSYPHAVWGYVYDQVLGRGTTEAQVEALVKTAYGGAVQLGS